MRPSVPRPHPPRPRRPHLLLPVARPLKPHHARIVLVHGAPRPGAIAVWRRSGRPLFARRSAAPAPWAAAARSHGSAAATRAAGRGAAPGGRRRLRGSRAALSMRNSRANGRRPAPPSPSPALSRGSFSSWASCSPCLASPPRSSPPEGTCWRWASFPACVALACRAPARCLPTAAASTSRCWRFSVGLPPDTLRGPSESASKPTPSWSASSTASRCVTHAAATASGVRVVPSPSDLLPRAARPGR